MSPEALDAEDLLTLLAESTGPRTRIRDAGILYAAAARPRAVILGENVYPTVIEQAAALLHGITRWQPLDAWNAGLAWTAAQVRLRAAGCVLRMPAAERMKLADDLIRGEVDTVDEIVVRLGDHLELLE